MNIKNINGVIVPAITFFDKDFNINHELNLLLLNHIILNGANAIFIFGTTGEGNFFINRFEQKIALIELALQIIKERIPLLVGIYGTNVDDVLNEIQELGKKFNNIGFVLTPPYKYKILKEDLGSYFENIIGSTTIQNPLYLYNNPALFKDIEIEPKILNRLINFPNLKGIKDSSDKINKYIQYLNFLSEDFSICCGKEGSFSTFLQLIPLELRKFCGIVPSFSNLSNICSKLYNAALEEKTLEIIKLQEELNEYRKKIYDIQFDEGKQQRGLKTAFYSLYKDNLSTNFNEACIVAPDLCRPLEDFTYDRMKATVRYLTNLNYIEKFYPIGEILYNFKDFKEKFSHLLHLGSIIRIKGPYGGKINATYRFKFENNDTVFRTRISKAFRYEDFVKEKILFPFLDNTLNMDTPDLRAKIEEILAAKTGSYIFNTQKPPIIPIGDLIYYDETLQIFPNIYTLQKYINGKPLYFILNKYKSENTNFNTSKFLNLFNILGKILAKLHSIKFNYFQERITDIGKEAKHSFIDIIQKELDLELQEAKKNKFEFNKEFRDYFKDNMSLIEGEDEPTLFHNDFQGQNIIIKEEAGAIQFKGLIDFDNWRIGGRAQDFSKILFWDINPLNTEELKDAFFNGYSQEWGRKIDKEFEKKIEFYSLLWFLKVYNFEMDKIHRGEQIISVDQRFPPPEVYLREIKKNLKI